MKICKISNFQKWQKWPFCKGYGKTIWYIWGFKVPQKAKNQKNYKKPLKNRILVALCKNGFLTIRHLERSHWIDHVAHLDIIIEEGLRQVNQKNFSNRKRQFLLMQELPVNNLLSLHRLQVLPPKNHNLLFSQASEWSGILNPWICLANCALQRSGFSHPDPAYGPLLIFQLPRLFQQSFSL